MAADLPEGWSEAKLGDLIEFKYGKSLPKSARGGTEYPVYGSNGVVGRHSEALTSGACIVIGRKGSFGEVAVSRTPAWPIDTTYYVDELHGQPLDFWYRYLQSLPLKELNRSTAVPGLSRSDAYTLQIWVPPLKEQERIVKKIEALFATIEQIEVLSEVVSELIKKYRMSVLLSSAYGKATETWRSDQPKAEAQDLAEKIFADYQSRQKRAEIIREKVSTTRVEIDALPVIPENWAWSRVGIIGDVQLGRQRAPKYHSGKNMRPYLRVANVFEDRIDTSDIMEMDFPPSDYRTYKLEHGDILLNEGQSLELVGRPAMFRGEVEDICFTNTLIRFRASSMVLAEYALIIFRYYMHSGRFQSIAKITTNLAHLGAGRFADLEFPLPPLEEQARIVEQCARQFVAIERLERQLVDVSDNCRRLKKSVLFKAFRGALVSQASSDEPASKLIERIGRARESRLTGEGSRKSKLRSGKVTMKSIIPVREVLMNSAQPLTAQELFRNSGYPDDASTELVERFFLDLRAGISSGLIVKINDSDEDLFSLKEASH